MVRGVPVFYRVRLGEFRKKSRGCIYRMNTLSRVDSNVHFENAAAAHAMVILYSSSSDARSKAV